VTRDWLPTDDGLRHLDSLPNDPYACISALLLCSQTVALHVHDMPCTDNRRHAILLAGFLQPKAEAKFSFLNVNLSL